MKLIEREVVDKLMPKRQPVRDDTRSVMAVLSFLVRAGS
jgi:hypothetical protein